MTWIPVKSFVNTCELCLGLLKESFLSYSYRAETTENHTLNLVDWPNYKQVELPTSQGVYCWREGFDWEQIKFWKLEWGCVERPWESWGHWILKRWSVLFASGKGLSIFPSWMLLSPNRTDKITSCLLLYWITNRCPRITRYLRKSSKVLEPKRTHREKKF